MAGGPPAEVLTAELIGEVYGVRAQVHQGARGRPTVVFEPDPPQSAVTTRP